MIRQVDDNWLEGKKGDKIGIFPTSFVKVRHISPLHFPVFVKMWYVSRIISQIFFVKVCFHDI